jgi:hypothetical protein
LNQIRTGKDRLAALALAGFLATLSAMLAPGWYVHNLTTRYEQANGPLWTAEVQRARGNVLDPLWEANHGAIQRLGEAVGLDAVTVLTLPMRLRRFSAFLTGETVDTSDAVASSPSAVPFVYGAPPSLLEKMREKDAWLRSDAGRRLLATMAGFGMRQSLDDTDYDKAPRTEQAQAENNPYARDGFRTYSFFSLARYAVIRFEDGDAAARAWYRHRLCAGDWDYDVTQARAALKAAGHRLGPCPHESPLPTFAQRVAANPQLPAQLWGRASKRFGIYAFALVLVFSYGIAYGLLRIARGGRRP